MTGPHARCLALTLALALPATPAPAQPMPFSFGAIGHVFRAPADDGVMRKAIIESDADNLAFVVVNGVKAADEPCSDTLYDQRLAMLSQAKNGLVLSLAGSDWADCKRSNGRPAAMERLTRVRDVYFQDEMSFGATRLPLSRQSTSSKFRSYAENARWEVGNIVFATINLPAPNNHYLTDAGRNGEFEDRLIANRYWLQRTFTYAQREKRDGIVLFCDGNPAVLSGRTGIRTPEGTRDGFVEVRRQIAALAGTYSGKVLVVHGSARLPAPKSIRWRGNLGELALPAGWLKVNVKPDDGTLFSLSER